ncbi:hypothetical protein BH11PSE9_BH11PSE9_20930 [soil metagenome]
MTSKALLDPLEMWHKALAQWETTVNELSNRGTSNEHYTRAMQKASTVALDAQQKFDAANSRLLEAMNLPSRQQVDELSGRLLKIEEMLALLPERTGGLPQATTAVPDAVRPPRTRKPPPRGTAVATPQNSAAPAPSKPASRSRKAAS